MSLQFMSAEAWSALVAAVVAIYTIVTNTIELKRGRLLKGIELMEAYSKDFDSDVFRKRRAVAAQYLLNDSRDNANPPSELCEILDFIEGIAFVHNNKLIEVETIWHALGSWLLPYSVATRNVVTKQQQIDPTLYEDLLPMFKAIETVEKHRHPSQNSFHLTSPTRVKRFLKEEAN